MTDNDNASVRIVGGTRTSPIIQREFSIFHTSYMEEVAFYSLISSGNEERMKKVVFDYFSQDIEMGHMTRDQLHKRRYWAVSCLTLATRAAIQGGLEERRAYNLLDMYICEIDGISYGDALVKYLSNAAIELASLVQRSAYRGCPMKLKDCLKYIDDHICEKISLQDLAKASGLSDSYISKLFKRHTGKSAGAYVMHRKLETAKTLLLSGEKQSMVAFYLGFCSPTHLITAFRKAYGVTPAIFTAENGNPLLPEKKEDQKDSESSPKE